MCPVSRADPPVRDFHSPLPSRNSDFRPVVVWTKENPTPWNDIKPDEGTKILTVNQQFSKSCVLLAPCAAPAPADDPTYYLRRWERKKL